jgi:CRISPR type III-B/RAMP module RAMP protein Cmr6
MSIPLPAGTAALVQANRTRCHPGLLLDKYADSWHPEARQGDLQQRMQHPTIDRVVEASAGEPPGLEFAELAKRRRAVLGAATFTAKTAGPLTMHLSRAGALENAGLCLHPIYGFAYLPGTGLKGLARAYAERVWLETQSEKATAWATIEEVFGWTPGSDLADGKPKPWKPADAKARKGSDAARSGSVVFHDAWPTSWPKLTADIVNNHHPSYYQNGDPPGDWDNPIPVYFLAVPAGTDFEFHIAGRRSDTSSELVARAREWLFGGLVHLGAGAKTAAGYGRFWPVEQEDRATFLGSLEGATTIEIVTPAFLGGADQNAAVEDPDGSLSGVFRTASLRGLLRKWWRAWNTELSPEELRSREASIFGSTKQGSRLRLAVEPRDVEVFERGTDMGGGGSPLGYLGYGPIAYDNAERANLTRFHALNAGSRVILRLGHSDSKVRNDALRSLWLMAALGGIGSRSRRGWGSFAVSGGLGEVGLPDLPSCGTVKEYREGLLKGLETLAPVERRPDAAVLGWTALSRQTRIVVSRSDFGDWRSALEDLGRRFAEFRSWDRRDTGKQAPPGPDYNATKQLLQAPVPLDSPLLPERAGFGMPYAQAYRSLEYCERGTDGRERRRMPTATFTPIVQRSDRTVELRRASPLLFKIGRLRNGRCFWQATWLPSRFVPDGSRIHAERTDTKPRRQLTRMPLTPPGPFGVGRAGADPQTTLVTEFLYWLERTAGLQSATSTTPAHLAGSVPASVKRIEKGQTHNGVLSRAPGGGWDVVFSGETRPVLIKNPDDVPADADGKIAEFYIVEANKHRVTARYARMKS